MPFTCVGVQCVGVCNHMQLVINLALHYLAVALCGFRILWVWHCVGVASRGCGIAWMWVLCHLVMDQGGVSSPSTI